MNVKVPVLASLLVTFCTTYHAAGPSGGYSDTKLGDRIYQVRFRGNGYTHNDRVSALILRRAAELTLENGFRFFTLSGQQTQTSHSMGWNFPDQSTIVRFLSSVNDDPAGMDAVAVIKATDAEAGDRLSPAAREALTRLQR